MYINKSLEEGFKDLIDDEDEPEILQGTFKEKCKELGEYGERLLKEYNYEENESRMIDINTITYGSNKKASWKCLDCENIWEADFKHRIIGRGCPKCANRKIIDTRISNKIKRNGSLYDWALKNGEFGKKLIADIDEEVNNKDGVSPYDAVKGSSTLLNWKCSKCGYQYKKSASHRSLYDCPACDGKAVKKGFNDAYTWCLNNGELGKQIIEEFDTENNNLSLNEITKGSNKIIQWKCKKGHVWKASIHNRIGLESMCPYCSRIHTSFAERYIYYALDSVIENVRRNYRNINGKLELDIYIPDYKVGIEYDGYAWHTRPIDFKFDSKSKEQHKINICKEKGIRVINIYDDGDTEEIKFKNDIIEFKYKNILKYKQLQSIITLILNELHIDKKVNFDDIKDKALSERKAVNFEDSLAGRFPKLTKEWHPTLNKLSPKDYSYGSAEKVYWQCTKCGYGKDGEWYTSISGRTSEKTACPKCRYSLELGRYKDKCGNIKIVSKYRPGQFAF